jgi:hypothetical protein
MSHAPTSRTPTATACETPAHPDGRWPAPTRAREILNVVAAGEADCLGALRAARALSVRSLARRHVPGEDPEHVAGARMEGRRPAVPESARLAGVCVRRYPGERVVDDVVFRREAGGPVADADVSRDPVVRGHDHRLRNRRLSGGGRSEGGILTTSRLHWCRDGGRTRTAPARPGISSRRGRGRDPRPPCKRQAACRDPTATSDLPDREGRPSSGRPGGIHQDPPREERTKMSKARFPIPEISCGMLLLALPRGCSAARPTSP